MRIRVTKPKGKTTTPTGTTLEPTQMRKVVEYSMGDHFTVLVDCNEGKRIPFPSAMLWRPRGNTAAMISIGTKIINMGRVEGSRGDIGLMGFLHVTGIERKGRMAELAYGVRQGILERQLRVLASGTKHPYLLLDIPLTELYGTGYNTGFREADITQLTLDAVFVLCQKYNVKIIGPVTAGSTSARRALGEYLVRLMLSHVKGEKFNANEKFK